MAFRQMVPIQGCRYLDVHSNWRSTWFIMLINHDQSRFYILYKVHQTDCKAVRMDQDFGQPQQTYPRHVKNTCSYNVHIMFISCSSIFVKSGASFHPLCTYNPQMSEFSSVEGRPRSRKDEGTAMTTQRWPKSETTAGASPKWKTYWEN